MKRIYKYNLKTTDFQQITSTAKIEKFLKIDVQKGNLVMWAIVDDTLPPETYNIFIFGTGHPIPDELVGRLEYLGSCQLMNDSFAGHVFNEWAATHFLR